MIMVHHVMKDGRRLDDISGYKVRVDELEGMAELMGRMRRRLEDTDAEAEEEKKRGA